MKTNMIFACLFFCIILQMHAMEFDEREDGNFLNAQMFPAVYTVTMVSLGFISDNPMRKVIINREPYV